MLTSCQREQHRKAGAILVAVTARKLLCMEVEVFRLAISLNEGGCSDQYAGFVYNKWLECFNKRYIPDEVEYFCLKVLTGRIVPVVRHIKAHKKGEER
jgi:hypothetical protein